MPSFNAGHAQVFQPGRLTLGFMTPFGHAAGAMADIQETPAWPRWPTNSASRPYGRAMCR